MEVISAYATKHSLSVSIPNENDYSYVQMKEDSSPDRSGDDSLGFALKLYYDMLESEEKRQSEEIAAYEKTKNKVEESNYDWEIDFEIAETPKFDWEKSQH
jgi:hypothetical protein